MTNEKQQNRKTFIDCYRIGRSLEYMDRYDQEQAWKKLNSAIQRKRLHRRISYMASVAAMVAIAFTSFYLWRGEDQAPAEKLADAQETVGQSGRPGVILSLSDGRRIDLCRHVQGTLRHQGYPLTHRRGDLADRRIRHHHRHFEPVQRTDILADGPQHPASGDRIHTSVPHVVRKGDGQVPQFDLHEIPALYDRSHRHRVEPDVALELPVTHGAS